MFNKEKKETTLEDIQKSLRINRALTLVTMLPIIAFLIIAVIAYIKINSFVHKVEPYVEKVKSIDFDGISNTMDEVDAFVNKVDWDGVGKTLSSIDADMLGKIDDIEGYLGEISSLTEMKDDFKKAMDNLDEVAKTLEGLEDKLSPVMKFFGK